MSDNWEQVYQLMGSEENCASFDDPHVTRYIATLSPQTLHDLAADPDKYRVCRHRLVNLAGDLNDRFAQKKEIIDLLLACTLAGVPMVLLGPPGTAKSALIRSFCQGLNLRSVRLKLDEFKSLVDGSLAARTPMPKRDEDRLFEYLVTRYTTPEEILGPVKIDAMLDLSLFFRDSTGMLPKAQIAFLDEVFKANSAILNALLSIINERIYYNAGQAFDVDLVTIFGASNESPDTEELAALYDRFPIRVVSESVPDEHVGSLMSLSLEMAYDKAVGSDPPAGGKAPGPIRQRACVNDFLLLARVNYVLYGGRTLFSGNGEAPRDGSAAFAVEFVEMFKSLREEFGISDRTPERLLRVAKALAMLEQADGPRSLGPDHLRVYQYCAPNADTARVLKEVVAETIERIKGKKSS